MKINRNVSLKELALIVCNHLKENNIDAVLTGGAVVSIYTNNKYQSFDLDFITYSNQKTLIKAMLKIGFIWQNNRYFTHPDTDYYVEFPPPPISIGNKPVHTFNKIENKNGYLKLLSATHSVMDRLASYYHWNDPQSLEQAIMVALDQDIDFCEIEQWSNEEGCREKYLIFLHRLNNQTT